VLVIVGSQGSGKTTTCAKLARYLRQKGRSPLLVAADIYRPAAIKQLQVLWVEKYKSRYLIWEKNIIPWISLKGAVNTPFPGKRLCMIDTAGAITRRMKG